MAKATKTTIQRLKKMKGNDIIGLAAMLYEMVTCAENIDEALNNGIELTADDYKFGYYTEINDNDCLTYKSKSYEKPYFNGIATRSNAIETTFTHGNNQVIITDINKLVRDMMKA